VTRTGAVPKRLTPTASPLRSLGQLFTRLRALLRRQDLRDLLLQLDLPREPFGVRLDELLPERVDLLIVRRVGEQLGLELPVERDAGRRSLTGFT
jgi:hypothetical protein